MISNSHFSDFKGTSTAIFIERIDSNLLVSHCSFDDCYKSYYYYSYPRDGFRIGGVCIIHYGNNASLNYVSCCSCQVVYQSIIATFNQNKQSNSHNYNEISLHNCISSSYFILTDITPAYFSNCNSSSSICTEHPLFHSGWSSVGGNSTYWTLTNNTCSALLGHNNLQINYYFLNVISNKNQYLFMVYMRGSYFVFNSILIDNKMTQINTGTLTLYNCIYDGNEDLIVNPTCVLVQTYSIKILNSCANFYQCACSNMNYSFRFKYMYSFIITLI